MHSSVNDEALEEDAMIETSKRVYNAFRESYGRDGSGGLSDSMLNNDFRNSEFKMSESLRQERPNQSSDGVPNFITTVVD